MKSRITLITLGVDDLDRAVRFYRDGLGLKTDGIVGQESEYGVVVFFDLQMGLRLALWPRQSLSHDSGFPLGKPSSTDICLAHNVSSKAEVDAVMVEASAAGATIVKPPRTPSGAATPDTSRIRTSIYGRWLGIRRCCRPSDSRVGRAVPSVCRVDLVAPRFGGRQAKASQSRKSAFYFLE